MGSITEVANPIRSENKPAAQRCDPSTLQRATDPDDAQFAHLLVRSKEFPSEGEVLPASTCLQE